MVSKPVIRIYLILMATALFLFACAPSEAETTSVASPPANQTGVAELDAIINAALDGKTPELRSMLAFTQTSCATVEGLGGPPKCLQGEPENTLVEVLPFLGPEGHFIRKAEIDNWSGLNVSQLYAVYQVSDKAYSDVNYPAGEFAIVFLGGADEKASVTLQVRQGKIVRIDEGVGAPPQIPAEAAARYLLPPLR